jgi:DHA2 family multidrug resistance protein
LRCRNLGATLDEATWVTTGFIIANVIVIPLTPWLQRRFGRKQYFVTSIVGFTLASFLCGIASSLDQLILFRIIQGAFGGGLLAVAQPLLRDTFPNDQLGLSQGIFTIAAIVGPALGLTLGGILTDQLSWRWIFDINVVPGVISVVLLLIFLRNPAEPERIPGDPTGISLLIVGLGSLQYLLDEGERNDWFSNGGMIACAVAAVLGLAAFVIWELRGTSHPIVALRAFNNRSIAVGSAIGLAIGMPLFGAVLMLPQYVNALLNYTATLSGLLVLVRAAPMALLTPVVGIIAQNSRVDSRYLLGSGVLIVTLGTVWQAFVMTSDTSFVALAFPVVLQGIGSSMLFVPLIVNVLGSVDQELSAPASAFLNLSFQLGGSIASALLVTVFDRRLDLHLSNLAGSITLARPQISQLINGAGTRSREVLMGLSELVQQQASAMAFADVFLVIAAATLIVIPLIFGLRRASSSGPAPLTLE